MSTKSVTKAEFDQFVADYPRPLKRHLATIFEPPILQLCDETLGVWPEFVVASYSTLGGDPNDIWAEVPCNWAIREEMAGKQKAPPAGEG